jgi:hypothetical protein
VTGTNGLVQNEGAGTIVNAWANYSQCINSSTSETITNCIGNYSDIGNSGTMTNAYHFYGKDLAGVATNGYYSWFDSRGVRRVKEDSAIDGVGQAIEALYNNQFTKYTPGAHDYERLALGEWNASNVAEIGTENGGTGAAYPYGEDRDVAAVKRRAWPDRSSSSRAAAVRAFEYCDR